MEPPVLDNVVVLLWRWLLPLRDYGHSEWRRREQTEGPLKWVSQTLPDRRIVPLFVGVIGLKAERDRGALQDIHQTSLASREPPINSNDNYGSTRNRSFNHFPLLCSYANIEDYVTHEEG